MTKANWEDNLVELPGKPEGPLRSNGSIMTDDRDNVVWYIGPGNKGYEHRVKTDTWFLMKVW